MQIECGLVTFEQVAKEMGAKKAGDKVNEIKLIRPTSKYEDDKGMPMINKITELTDEDFIIPEVKTESKEDLFKAQEQAGANGQSQSEEQKLLQGLFG
jgi:hypothetical protein